MDDPAPYRYQILRAEGEMIEDVSGEIVELVRTNSRAKWQPLGGPSVAFGERQFWEGGEVSTRPWYVLVQAMTRE